jgi:hypothetical protein
MAQQYSTTGGNLVIPGAYPSVTVQTGNAGLATTGVLMLIGEADAGPDYTAETDLSLNVFGPDQYSSVLAKYKSGALVNAFLAATAPANDPSIVGQPSQMYLLKTNVSTKATSTALTTWSAAAYGTLSDQSYGKLGNLIYYTVTANRSEVVPTTGAFTWIPPAGSVGFELRVNGGAALTSGSPLAAATIPSAFVSAINGNAGVTASGGVDRTTVANLTSTPTIAVSGASGLTATFTLAGKVAWDTTPSVGDTLYIITDLASANRGGYVITAVTTTTIVATKVADVGANIGNPTAPTNAGAFTLTAATNFRCFSPVTIAVTAANPTDGFGKSLEIIDTVGGTDLFNRNSLQLSATPVTWVSKAATPINLTSGAEYRASLNTNRQVDAVTETILGGGNVALAIGYKGTSGTCTITATTLTTAIVGGTGANLNITLSSFPTINDLVSFISSQTGYVAAAGTASLGQFAPTTLDRGTFNIGTSTITGSPNGRIKRDAADFATAVSQGSVLVNFPTAPTIGVPQPTSPTTSVFFLSGGAKGGSTNATFTAAIDACEKLRGNFLIPLISQDATADITAGLTESSSTYTVDSINAYAKSHCLKLSTLKRRRNRQAFVSKKGTFVAAKNAAGNLASYRVSLCFQDVQNIDSTGTLVQFQPWMGSVLAAGMQAAGFYKAIVNKGVNCSGVVQGGVTPADFLDQDDPAVEDALLSGLLVMRKSETGGFRWVSDQTTYAKDSNFVFNSIQATYGADTIALTTALRMQNAFVGQSVSDVSAGVALSFLQGIMSDFMRLKLIAPSTDAPLGYKNAVIKISGPTMLVSLEVKLAGAIYFIPISFLVSQVTQSATG